MLKIFEWILGKGESEEPFEIEFYNLSEWLWKYVEGEVSRDITEYSLLLKSLKEKTETLEKLNVEDAEVEKKLKELVRGNKPAYTNSLKILTQNIEPPKSLSYQELKNFCEKTELALNNFSKRTIRNYAILKTIIGKELEEIVQILKQLEFIELKLKNEFLMTSKLRTLEDIRHKLLFFYEMELSKDNRTHGLIELNKKRGHLENELTNINKKIESLRTGEEFNEYGRLNTRLSNLGADELNLKGTLSGMFSELSRPLRKLDKGSKLITMYDENAYSSLMEDNNMEIIALLNELKTKVDSGNIEVKNKKKALSQVDLLINKLKESKEKAKEISKEIKVLQSKLSLNKFENDEKELVDRFQTLQRELSDVITEMQSLAEEKKEMNLIKITKDIEKLVGRRVVVRNAPVM